MLEVRETTIGRLRIDPTRLRTDGWRKRPIFTELFGDVVEKEIDGEGQQTGGKLASHENISISRY